MIFRLRRAHGAVIARFLPRAPSRAAILGILDSPMSAGDDSGAAKCFHHRQKASAILNIFLRVLAQMRQMSMSYLKALIPALHLVDNAIDIMILFFDAVGLPHTSRRNNKGAP